MGRIHCEGITYYEKEKGIVLDDGYSLMSTLSAKKG